MLQQELASVYEQVWFVRSVTAMSLLALQAALPFKYTSLRRASKLATAP